MQFRRSDIELMSPAGDFESLMAAIQAGADAVYFGVGKLNMRSGSAKNFRPEDLPEIARIGREHRVKTYLTLNITIYDHELEDMKRLVDAAARAKISALIASDWAVIQYGRKQGIDIHISTQANISNMESLKYFANFSDVVVLARELTMEQMQYICEQVERQHITGPSGKLLRIEVFIHGALCMAVSGKCYMSLHQSNKSANRGQCRQECRKAYIVTEKESGKQLEIDNEYIMSPKDLNTVGFLDLLVRAGVKVMKIEGRGRSPEYVYTVTKTYDEALRAIEANTFDPRAVKPWEKRLATVFNRGFWGGYYMGKEAGEWSKRYGSHATKRKVYIGKGTNYFRKIGIAEFHIESQSLKVGDEILITGPTTGVIQTRVEEIRVDMKNVNETVRGDVCSIPISTKVRRADKLYKVVDARQVVTQS